MPFLRALTRLQLVAALTILGIALALVPLGLDAIGYELSPKQGYATLAVAALFIVVAVVVFFWPLMSGAWSWIRRDAEFHELREALNQLEGRLYEVEQYKAMPPEEIRARQDQRRKRIDQWRMAIQKFNYEAKNFADSYTYSEMRPHLRPYVVQRLESPWSAVFRIADTTPRRQGRSGDKHILLDEVARIEKEWGLI